MIRELIPQRLRDDSLIFLTVGILLLLVYAFMGVIALVYALIGGVSGYVVGGLLGGAFGER